MSSNVQNLSVSSPSICIPYVANLVEKSIIHATFNTLFGERNIERIDVVFREKDNGEKFKRVFVHFRQWPDNKEAEDFRRRLLAGEEVKIMYDEPWFWKCRASQTEKPETRTTTTEPIPIQIPRQRRMVLSEFIPRQILRKPATHTPPKISEKIQDSVKLEEASQNVIPEETTTKEPNDMGIGEVVTSLAVFLEQEHIIRKSYTDALEKWHQGKSQQDFFEIEKIRNMVACARVSLRQMDKTLSMLYNIHTSKVNQYTE